MRAIVLSGAGGPETLRLEERPDPTCGPDEVRVRVRATAVNRADLLQRRGRYPAPPGAPADIPGLEFAGEVVERGARVRELGVGERVMGILAGGGYAEQVAVHERLCLRVPDGLGWEEAAAFPEAFLTAYDALFTRGGLAGGEAVLVHAAGSGVGTAAVQLAAVAGARVVALSRSPAKRRRLPALGAARALDPAADDLPAALSAATGATGVDLVLDLIGGPALELNLRALRPGGRVVTIGLLGGARAEIDLGRLLSARLTLAGSVLRSRPLEEKIALTRAVERRIVPWLRDGRIRSVVDTVVPLERAAAAHERMERNANFGKIVLRVGGPA